MYGSKLLRYEWTGLNSDSTTSAYYYYYCYYRRLDREHDGTHDLDNGRGRVGCA